jgi:hypothetical protein
MLFELLAKDLAVVGGETAFLELDAIDLDGKAE